MNRIEMYNLQTRFVQFKEQKKIKTYLIVRIELSVNENALKGLKYKSRLSFWTCLKYVICNLKTFKLYNSLTNKKYLNSGYRLQLIFLYKTVPNIL